MTQPRAVLILDIDGTINPYAARTILSERPEALPGYEEHSLQDEHYGEARVFLQTAVLRAAIQRLQHSGVELLWGSAWNESSNFILRMLFPEGMEDWPTIVFPEEIDFSFSVQSWKLSTVREFIEAHYAETVPLIWADDEIFDDAKGWLTGRSGSGLLLRTDRHRGLTEAHWEQIFRFVDSLELS